ncbi:PREDICTED: sodium/potassium/calcium exchanger 6, mitochondrial-like [Drosophila arizonae]|uniref:Sodium/potassium/calcium exchanger 6, mitochondrial-like n=1 Tax=Drosophila arizonae TaxID=7263 RepID=A0ABM1PH57_DROAR|nr:PREDICTED: sodium/potassium/calcium exchanger 6, mitochondrial-like [Drosophila arizonae]
MNVTFSIEDVYKSMRCNSLMYVDFSHRCFLSKAIKHCIQVMQCIDYFRIMYCQMNIETRSTEVAVMCASIVIMGLLMLAVAHLVDKYIAPLLKIVSIVMHMNQYLAGITLLCFGNHLPELIINLTPVMQESPLFNITLSNAIAVVLINGGLICYLRPFKINGHGAVRDLLFMMLACELVLYEMDTDNKITRIEGLSLICLYFIYLIINIVDLKLMRNTLDDLRQKVDALSRKTQPTLKTKSKLRHMQNKLAHMELDSKNVDKYNHSEIFISAKLKTYYGKKTSFDDDEPDDVELRALEKYGQTRPSVIVRDNEKYLRDIFYNPENPRNMFLLNDLWDSINPISLSEFKRSSYIERIYIVLIMPVSIICSLFVPVVDTSVNKHGWSKLLNCIQIVTTPFIVITLWHALTCLEYQSSFIVLYFNISVWSFCVSVPLAIFVFWKTRTDKPPRFHKLFMILTFSISLVLLKIFATEIEVLSCVIGLVSHMSEDFASSSIRAFCSALSDSIFNISLAIKGYGGMAFAAGLAGPFFSFTIGLGLYFLTNPKVSQLYSKRWLLGEQGDNSYFFFMLIAFSTLLWIVTFNFLARRSVAIFDLIMYIVYLIYAILVEWSVIHAFTFDPQFEPT